MSSDGDVRNIKVFQGGEVLRADRGRVSAEGRGAAASSAQDQLHDPGVQHPGAGRGQDETGTGQSTRERECTAAGAARSVLCGVHTADINEVNWSLKKADYRLPAGSGHWPPASLITTQGWRR